VSLEWRGEPTRIALDSLRAAGVAGTIEGASAVIKSYERARAVRAGVEWLKKKVSTSLGYVTPGYTCINSLPAPQRQ
jgi:hypothetical protein